MNEDLKKEDQFYNALLLIALYPWLRISSDILISNYQLITGITFFILFFAFFGLNIISRPLTYNRKYLLLQTYLTVVTLFSVADGSTTLFTGLSSLIRFLYVLFGLAYVSIFDFSEGTEKKVIRSLFVVFEITVLASLIQSIPVAPLHSLLISYGGNLMSSTVIGLTRANGAIGGTVIGYSSFIVLNTFAYVFGKEKLNIIERYIYVISLLVAAFLNYSRATFLCLLIFVGFYLIFFKMKKINIAGKILITVIIIAFVIWYLNTDNEVIRYIFENDQYRQQSDTTRISSTITGIKEMDNPLKLLFGISVGQNTGFSTTGKIQTDSTFVSFLLDYGVIGSLLLIVFIIKLNSDFTLYTRTKNDKSMLYLATITLCLNAVINSGMLENYNLFILPYVAMIMKCFLTDRSRIFSDFSQ